MKQGRKPTGKIVAPEKPFTAYKRLCYYNALSYSKQHDTDLVVGLLLWQSYVQDIENYKVSPDGLMRTWLSSRPIYMEHGWCQSGETVIDPTLGLEELNGSYYLGVKVPEEYINKIKWKPNKKDGPGFEEVESYLKNFMNKSSAGFNLKQFMDE